MKNSSTSIDANVQERRRFNQRGLTLIEVLIAVLILGIGSAGVAFGTIGALRSSHYSRVQTDMNVLVTSFGESIKALPYETCGTPDDYASLFATREATFEGTQLQGRLGATLSIIGVQDKIEMISRCPGGDSGVQSITLVAENDVVRREITVVKRNPALSSAPPYINFEFVRRSPINSPVVEFGLQPKVSSEVGIFRYDWWCYTASNPNDAWMLTSTTGTPNREPDHQTTELEPGDPKCAKGYPGDGAYEPIPAAPTAGPVQHYYAVLQVTDNAGITWPAIVGSVEMPTTNVNTPPSTAVIRQVSTPPCTAAVPCTVGQSHRFDGIGSAPGDGTEILKCMWTFSDGREPEIILGPDCIAHEITHSFYDPSDNDISNTWIRLTLTDGIGRTIPTQRNLVIEGEPVVPPTAQLRAGVVPYARWTNPSDAHLVFNAGSLVPGRAPQKLYLSAAGSQSNDGNGLTYLWEFSDNPGVTRDTLQTQYTFNDASTPLAGMVCITGDGTLVQGAFRVRLTVTDSENGATDSKTLCVQVGEDAPRPTIFSFMGTGYGCERPVLWIFCQWGYRYTDLKFGWEGVARAPGDTITFDIRIGNNFGVNCIIVDHSVRHLNHGLTWNGNSGQGTNRQYGNFFSQTWDRIEDLNIRLSDSCIFQIRTHRTTADGTTFPPTEWSAPQPMRR